MTPEALTSLKINEASPVTVRELLALVGQSEVYTIQPTASVEKMAKIWRQHNIGALLVVGDEDQLMGIVTERDGARKVLAENKLPSEVKVGQIMTPIEKIVKASMEDDILDLIKLFKENDFTFRHIPTVVKGDVYDGIVSERDVFRYLVNLLEQSSQSKD